MAKAPMKDVVVLLPGILGSVLQRDGKDVWALSGHAIVSGLLSLGGSVKDLMLADQSTDPDVAADGVVATALLDDVHLIPGLWKIDGYSKIQNAIAREIDVEKNANFFTFPYDWRRDNQVAAKQLAVKAREWLGRWRQRPGNADAKLILMGHSMGGLVARYFLEVLDGWRDTRMLVTFGTPYFGSLNALNTLSNGLKVGFGPLGVDLSPFAQSLPSLHQLLPIYECYDAGDGKLAHAYDVAGIPNLDQAKAKAANAFHDAITTAVTKHQSDNAYLQSRYVTHPIVGRTQRTNQSARLSGGVVEMLNDYQGRDEEGDGTVPLVSATPRELRQQQREFYVDELHASLQNSDAVLVNLIGILKGLSIKPKALADAAGLAPLRLDLRDAYPAGQPITMKTTLAEENNWAKLDANIVKVAETGDTVVASKTIGPLQQAERTAEFPPLPQGTYRVTVKGQGVMPVNDVFLVM